MAAARRKGVTAAMMVMRLAYAVAAGETKFKLGDGSVTELDDLPAGIYEWAVGIVKQSAPNGTTRPGRDNPIECTGRWSDTETHGCPDPKELLERFNAYVSGASSDPNIAALIRLSPGSKKHLKLLPEKDTVAVLVWGLSITPANGHKLRVLAQILERLENMHRRDLPGLQGGLPKRLSGHPICTPGASLRLLPKAEWYETVEAAQTNGSLIKQCARNVVTVLLYNCVGTLPNTNVAWRKEYRVGLRAQADEN
jgi:hypothetical protein